MFNNWQKYGIEVPSGRSDRSKHPKTNDPDTYAKR